MIDRGKIKKEYKQTLTPMGIFQIKNTKNGKIFLGKSKNLNAAYNRQMMALESGQHINREMQKDWNESGQSAFTFEIIDRLEPKEDPSYKYDDDLNVLKELWFEKLQPYGDKGYNTPADLRPANFT